MTAKESAGFQQFPQASFPTPSKEEITEQVSIVLNLKDGQKSVGQSDEDPYTRAISYIERHKIVEVFQVTMVTSTQTMQFIIIQDVLAILSLLTVGGSSNSVKLTPKHTILGAFHR